MNNHAITGLPAGTGTLSINHSGTQSLSNPFSGPLNIQHVGPGTTSLTSPSYGTGTISVTSGTLLVNGGTVASQAATATRPVVNQVRIDTAAANNMSIGQAVTINGSNNNTPFTTDFYILNKTVDAVDPTKTLILVSGNVSNTAGNADGSLNNVWNVASQAGTGTGLRSVVANG